MKAEEHQPEKQIENEHLSKQTRRAINQLAFGSLVILWGSLLILKQAGIIEKNVSTWPYPLAAFGVLLVVSGIYRLSTSRGDMN